MVDAAVVQVRERPRNLLRAVQHVQQAHAALARAEPSELYLIICRGPV